MIEGTVTSQGLYGDNKEKCELYISSTYYNSLPHEHGKKTIICLIINGVVYQAGVHEKQTGEVWVSSVLNKKESKKRIRLVDALNEVGIKKGNKILLTKKDGCYCLLKR